MRTLKALYYFYLLVWYKNILKSPKYNDVIYEGARDLGGIYIKLLQFVSLRTDVFDISHRVRFLSFYDQAPIEEFNIRQMVRRELGANASEILDLEETPFASGTFGQVYKGKLRDGTQIIVKAKKYGLKRKLRADFAFLKILGYLFNLFFDQNFVNVQQTIKEFREITFKELDYKQEVQNALEFYDFYKGSKNVFIPKTYPHLSSRNIVTQEYVGGISLTDLIRYKQEGGDYGKLLIEKYNTDPKVILPNISYEILIQGFVYAKYYGDPHPGNIKVLPDNKFAFIDFGIAEKPPHGMKAYFRILRNFAQRIEDVDWEDLGRNFIELGAPNFHKHLELFDSHFGTDDISLKKLILENYTSLTHNIRGKYYAVEAQGKQDFLGIMMDMTSLGSRFGVSMPERMFTSVRSFYMFKNYAMYLEPDFHFSRYNFQRFLEIFSEHQVRDEEKKDKQVTIEESLEKIFDWAGNLAEVDMGLYRKIESKLSTLQTHV